MRLTEIMEKRRAYRALASVEITPDLLEELAQAASLSPSCYNNQPWRYVAAYDPKVLEQLHEALPKGNAWAKAGSMIMAVCSEKELDCVIKDREYYLFDTGMATAFLLLKATELGLVAHPIAGYKKGQVKEILGIPQEMQVIALIVFGKHDLSATELMNQDQIAEEAQRPKRLEHSEFFFHNKYKE